MDKTPLNRAEEKFLNDFIKKYDIERRARESAEIFLNVDDPKVYKSLKISFDVLNPENLRLADNIGYVLGQETVFAKIFVLENNQRKFAYFVYYDKDGQSVDDWGDNNLNAL